MAQLISVKTFEDARGTLSVIESEIGFAIKRLFYIYRVSAQRGGHGHYRAKLALIAVHGQVLVQVQTPSEDRDFRLEEPKQCLLLSPEDWHSMTFSDDAVLLVLASEIYDADDYFYEKYRD